MKTKEGITVLISEGHPSEKKLVSYALEPYPSTVVDAAAGWLDVLISHF